MFLLRRSRRLTSASPKGVTDGLNQARPWPATMIRAKSPKKRSMPTVYTNVTACFLLTAFEFSGQGKDFRKPNSQCLLLDCPGNVRPSCDLLRKKSWQNLGAGEGRKGPLKPKKNSPSLKNGFFSPVFRPTDVHHKIHHLFLFASWKHDCYFKFWHFLIVA